MKPSLSLQIGLLEISRIWPQKTNLATMLWDFQCLMGLWRDDCFMGPIIRFSHKAREKCEFNNSHLSPLGKGDLLCLC